MSTPVTTKIPTNEIDYDEDNPRIQLAFDLGKEKNEANIKLALGHDAPDEEVQKGTTIIGLKNSIRANGGIISPLSFANKKTVVIWLLKAHSTDDL